MVVSIYRFLMNRTPKIQKVLLLVGFMLSTTSFGIQHKFYLSVTQVSHSEKDAAVQIITRVFIDDMNAVLTERYGIEAHLGSDMEKEMDKDYLEKYLRTKFVVGVNGMSANMSYWEPPMMPICWSVTLKWPNYLWKP